MDAATTLGFVGPVWLVNPGLGQVGDVMRYPSLRDLPDVPDVTFQFVSSDRSIDRQPRLNLTGTGRPVRASRSRA